MSENSVIGHFQKSRFSVAISIREKSIFPSFFVEFLKKLVQFWKKGSLFLIDAFVSK